jgi:hypothetical protein
MRIVPLVMEGRPASHHLMRSMRHPNRAGIDGPLGERRPGPDMDVAPVLRRERSDRRMAMKNMRSSGLAAKRAM